MIPDLAKHSEKLGHFYTVSRSGGYHPAARKLGLATTSMLYSVKQLESVLGTKLFFRLGRRIVLTPAGEKLDSFCENWFSDLNDLTSIVRRGAEPGSKRLKVGTFASIAVYFWPVLLRSLPDSSQVTFSMMTGRSHDILEALSAGSIDVALTVEEQRGRAVIRHELFQDDYSFFASTSRIKKNPKRDELSSHPLLYIPDAIDQDSKFLRDHVYEAQLRFLDELEFDSFEVVAAFVQAGHGIAILPNRVARQLVPKIQKLKIEGMPMNFGAHRFFLSYRRDSQLSQRIVTSLLKASRLAVSQIFSTAKHL